MLRLRKRLGQSTAEYAILIGVVIAAVVGMQAWVSGNIRAKIYDVATRSGSLGINGLPTNLLVTNLFEPSGSRSLTTSRGGSVGLARNAFGGSITRTYNGELTNRSGNVTVQTGISGNAIIK